jgi:hypothetical protein
MFNDPKDVNRDLNYRDPSYVPPATSDVGWGLPLAILAVIVVIGGLFWFGHNTETTQTAANQPRIERTVPPAAPSPVVPAPPATTPQK